METVILQIAAVILSCGVAFIGGYIYQINESTNALTHMSSIIEQQDAHIDWLQTRLKKYEV
jgi:hypothetical protein